MQGSSRPLETTVPDVERLYLDFDSFFATAEQHFNPALRGKPLGVLSIDSAHTGCIAVSREAKSLGVKSASSVADARKLAPDMIFVIARPDAYVRLHNRIIEIVEACLPVSDVRSIDELVCHLLPSEAADAAGLAARIKAALAREFSSGLTCSIGIAKTELLAKVGAELCKPDGFTLLQAHDLPMRLADIPLRNLPGVSDGIGARMEKAGIADFEALWRIGPKHARALWGSIEGERFWNGLHGKHFERPETEKRMFGHSRMLPFDWRTPERVHCCARQLTLSAGRRLRRAGLRATKLTLGLRGGRSLRDRERDAAGPRWNVDVPFRAACDDRSLSNALSLGMAQSRREVRFKPRSVSVMLHGLVSRTEDQPDLFHTTTGSSRDVSEQDATRKWERLSDTLDTLRSVHGPAAVSLGAREEVPGGYLGAKIAFGRIPDVADFSEAQTRDGDTHFSSF